MRLLGTLLMLFGTFLLLAAALTVFGPRLRANGIDLFGAVTSLSGAVLTGAICLVAGAVIRRWASRRRQQVRPVA